MLLHIVHQIDALEDRVLADAEEAISVFLEDRHDLADVLNLVYFEALHVFALVAGLVELG